MHRASPIDQGDWGQQGMAARFPSFAKDYFQDTLMRKAMTFQNSPQSHSAPNMAHARDMGFSSYSSTRPDVRPESVDPQYQMYQQGPQSLAYLDSLAQYPRASSREYSGGEQDYSQQQSQQLMCNIYGGGGYGDITPQGHARQPNGATPQGYPHYPQVATQPESKVEKRRRQNRESQQRFRDKRRHEKQDVAAKKTAGAIAKSSAEKRAKKASPTTKNAKDQGD